MSLPENSLSAKKAKSFLGRAQIDLRRLQFGIALSNEHREESKKAQQRLLKVFEFEGCRRLDHENFVDGLISRQCFDTALFRKGLTRETFKDSCSTADGCVQTPIKLDLNSSIQCLNGLQRIRAAEAFLDNNDKWWIVNLYEDATFERALETHLYESYNHEQQYTDGIIFRNIRRYARAHDAENEKKWWARLTATKRKDLTQLLSNHKLSLAFDALIDYAGLWTPIRLGTLHRFHALKCTKELKSYLRHIHTVWESIIPTEYRMHVDSRTVSMLEMLAPSASTNDAARVRQLMLDRCIFPQLEDIHARNEILNRIQSQKCMIPSLRTFFEDQKYLEPCSKILKQLLGVKSKRPIWKEFKANYWGHESEIKVQISETKNLLLPGPLGKKERAKLGYLQLWMFCFRHWPEMTSFTPRLESRLKITDEADVGNIEVRPKSARRDHNPALWQKLACLAMQVGFETSNICKLAEEDAEMVQAKQFLKSARPEWKSNRSDCERKIADILKSMQETSSQSPQTPIWVDDGVTSWPREKRCGKPHEADHEHDKSVMFATMFYHPLQSSQTITSALVKRNVLEAFFDKYITPIRPEMSILIQSLENETVVHDKHQQPLYSATASTKVNHLQAELQQLKEERERLCEQLTSTQLGMNTLRNDLLNSKQEGVAQSIKKTQLEKELIHLKEINNAYQKKNAKLTKELSDLRNATSNIFNDEHLDDFSDDEHLDDILGRQHEGPSGAALPKLDVEKEKQVVGKGKRHFREDDVSAELSSRHQILKFRNASIATICEPIFEGCKESLWRYDIQQIMSRRLSNAGHINICILDWHSEKNGGFASTLLQIPDNIPAVESFLESLQSLDSYEESALHIVLPHDQSISYRIVSNDALDAKELLVIPSSTVGIFYSKKTDFVRFFQHCRERYPVYQAMKKRQGVFLESQIRKRSKHGKTRSDWEDMELEESEEP